jgi:phenylacetate-CoA ligase
MPPGQNGEIYITHLTNDYMPLIRYKVGDFGAGLAGICECGRGLPLMKVAVTKESDIFTLSNNKTYSSEIFDYINLAVSKAFPNAILQFRVVQKDMDYFEIEFVGGSERYKNGVKIFDDKMREKLGSDINVAFKKVNKIRREPSGKLRYFISEIN